MEMTPQHFHLIPTSCVNHVANYAHHKTLYIHLAYSYALNEQGTQYCSVHSLPSSGVATPGPIQAQALVNFWVSALVNHAKSTYLNRNSIAVYWIMSCRIKHLSTIF